MTHLRGEGRNVADRKIELGLIVSLAISAGSWLFSTGIVYAQVQENSKKIVELRIDFNDAAKDKPDIIDRLARIEEKLAFLVDERSKAK